MKNATQARYALSMMRVCIRKAKAWDSMEGVADFDDDLVDAWMTRAAYWSDSIGSKIRTEDGDDAREIGLEQGRLCRYLDQWRTLFLHPKYQEQLFRE